MSALTLPHTSLAHVHQEFVAALPAMENVLRFQARRLPRQQRDEAVADGLAACWHAWSGLLRRGKDPLAVGPTGIAANAARFVRNGRRLGTGTCGRGAMDIFSQRAQRRLGLKVVSLDHHDATERGEASDAWREWFAEDNHVTPADEAAFRVDFESWLDSLPARKRQMAELLAAGHGTSEVARLLGVTLPAVSIARTRLEASWRSFQGDPIPAIASGVRRPVGRPRKGDGRVRRQAR